MTAARVARRRGARAPLPRRRRHVQGGRPRSRRCAASASPSTAAARWRWSANPAAARARSPALVTLIEPPSAGRLELDGTDPAGADAATARRLRRTVQIVFQNPYGSLNPRQKITDILQEPLVINTDVAGRRARPRR